MSETITVLLVDDHAVVRQGVRTFLETQADLSVVGEANEYSRKSFPSFAGKLFSL